MWPYKSLQTHWKVTAGRATARLKPVARGILILLESLAGWTANQHHLRGHWRPQGRGPTIRSKLAHMKPKTFASTDGAKCNYTQCAHMSYRSESLCKGGTNLSSVRSPQRKAKSRLKSAINQKTQMELRQWRVFQENTSM